MMDDVAVFSGVARFCTLQSAAKVRNQPLQDWLGLRKRTSERYFVISVASLFAPIRK
jgi:hypothetical protein